MSEKRGSRRKKRKQSAYAASERPSSDPRQLALGLEALLKAIELDSTTLNGFWERWISDYARANRQKPRGIDSKESALRTWLLPMMGALPLNRIADSHIQSLKAAMGKRSAKTVNNVLSVLSTLLKTAVRWRVLERMPVTIQLLRVATPIVEFYDFEEYARLVVTAEEGDVRSLAVVLLGGDSGLRMGEMAGLEWPDLDFKRRLVHVRRSVSQGDVTLPKGGKYRSVPMTEKVHEVLASMHVNRSTSRVLVRDDGSDVSEQVIRTRMTNAQKASGVSNVGRTHILRHTFCSHLAMKGAPLIAIKELAGHESERTTMRYMHLAPNEKARAIELLNMRGAPHGKQPPPQTTAVSPTGFEPVGETGAVVPGTSGQGATDAGNQESRKEDGCLMCDFLRQPCTMHAADWSPSLVGKVPPGKS